MKLTNKTVPISALRLSKYNWKRNITEEDVADLAENMEEIGNLHPIIVRSVGKAGTMYEILAGARRWRAHRMMGSKKIEVRVVKCDDTRAGIISYSENLKTKKPDSREWSVGVKHLVNLLEKIQRVGVPKNGLSSTKSKTSSDFLVSGSKKSRISVMGRPKTARAQAVKTAAKNIGTSERAVRDALRRAEDLIPSAARALELGTISQDQANKLAGMSVSDQRMQLPTMVVETRDQTRRRVATEKLQDMEDKTPAILNMLAAMFLSCKDIKNKADVVLKIAKDTKLDKKEITDLPNYAYVEEAKNCLIDLLELIENQSRR